MLTLEQAYAQKELLQGQIDELQDTVNTLEHDPVSLAEDELLEKYHESLNDLYNDCLSGLPFNVPPVHEMMQSADPIMYRTGFNDFVDNFIACDRLDELEEYTSAKSELEDLQSELEDLEEEIERLEDEEE